MNTNAVHALSFVVFVLAAAEEGITPDTEVTVDGRKMALGAIIPNELQCLVDRASEHPEWLEHSVETWAHVIASTLIDDVKHATGRCGCNKSHRTPDRNAN